MAAAASAAARRSLPLILPAAAACGTSMVNNNNDNHLWSSSSSSVDGHSIAHAADSSGSRIGRYLAGSCATTAARCDRPPASAGRPTVLRKRMTSIGRFSMQSETPSNLSIPTFFLALSNKKTPGGACSASGDGMSSSEFESAWMRSGMPGRHPRFHSRVSSQDDRYFEYEPAKDGHTSAAGNDSKENLTKDAKPESDPKAELHRHVTDTVHPSSYRTDLRMRIERLLTTPLDLTDKLWEVFVSSGRIGSSGAISRLKVGNAAPAHTGAGIIDGQESLLLFRSHHSLADGVSLISALGDLVDEAEDIRDMIKAEIKRRKAKSKELSFLRRLLRSLQKLIWFFLGSIQSMAHQTHLLWTTPRNPFEEALGDALKEMQAMAGSGRSISWCDAAPLDEAKAVARAVGPKVTVNDVFVSCVSAAVTRQLEEHRERASVMKEVATGQSEETEVVHPAKSSINIVVPVHLMGGILPEGTSVGNKIGAFVARVPAHMEVDSTTPASDRLLSVHSSLASVKRSPAPILSYLAARFAADYLPEGLAKRLFRGANANAAVAISNARGFDRKVHIDGRPLEAAHGFLPLPPGLPCGVVVQSYAGVVSISLTAEKWAVPDADRFVGWILDEYVALCEECRHRR